MPNVDLPVKTISCTTPHNGTHPNLRPHHYEMLRASAISDEIITQRGYRSIDDPALLAQYGFSQAQRRLGSGLYIPMYTTTGEEIPGQFRSDNPRTIRDRIVKYETPAGRTMRLDVLPLNIESLKNPLTPLVVTEGVKKADAGASKRLCIIGLPGVWNWRGRNQYGGLTALGDWESIALKDREVLICFDNDYSRNNSVLMALHRLAKFLRSRGAIVYCINLPESEIKIGLDDFFAQDHSLDDLMTLKTVALPAMDKQTQAEVLISIAEASADLMLTDGNERLAAISYADGHREVYAIGEKGSSFRDWVISEYRREHGPRPPSGTALSQAIEAISADCWRYGRIVSAFTRFAAHEDKIYLDLALPQSSKAIEIDEHGWRLTDSPPVVFRRAPGMLPLPIPQRGGTLDLIPTLFGLDPKSKEAKLIKAWNHGAMHPHGPYAHLKLTGEPGARKTTIAEMLRSFTDPNMAPVRKPPKDDEALVLAARNAHIVVFDNLSYVESWLSDSLCCLSTGYGFSRRTLYKDSDETVYFLRRPVILTGVTEIVSRGDLLDRLVSVELPVLGDGTRKEDSAMKAEFNKQHPFILGAILDAISKALQNWRTVKTGALPRMADFAVWVEAAAPSLGLNPGEFLELYKGLKDDATGIEIDASPVAQTLLKYLENNPKGMEEVPAHDFFVTLRDLHTNNGQSRPNKNWPGTVEGFGKNLVRIKSVMRRVGWNLDSKRHKTGMRWQITPLDQDAGSDHTNLHQTPKTYTNSPEPTPEPTPHNALNEDKLSENSAFGVGDVGFSTNPKYVPHSTQNGTESMCVIPSSTHVLDMGKNPTSPTPQPPLSGDDITTEYF
jgi:hypothetical protein